MRKRGWIAFTVCAGLLIIPAHRANAQLFGIGNATEWTQLLNYAQLCQSYLKQAQTALQSVQMAQMMVREGQQLVTHPTTSIASDLATLANVLQQSQGLAGGMAQMDSQFQRMYPSFDPRLTSYAAAYGNWSTSTLNTIHGSLNTAGMQANLLNNERNFMAKIQAMLQTPAGQDQALQLGNVIGTEEVAQLQKLRQLMIADMTAKGAVAAQQANAQAADQAGQSSFTMPKLTYDARSW